MRVGPRTDREVSTSVKRIALSFVAVAIATLSISCNKGDDGGDDGDDLRPLSRVEQVKTLEVYLPWQVLREALETAPYKDRDASASREARAIANELRATCEIRETPTEAVSPANGLARVSGVEIRPGKDKTACPIEFRKVFTFEPEVRQDSSEIQGRMEFAYEALSARALDWAPLNRWNLKGPIHLKTESENGEIRHQRHENFSGELETQNMGALPLHFELQSQTRLHGASSETAEIETRRFRMPDYWVEWRRERVVTDGQTREEKHFLNRDPISAGDIDKLSREAQRPR